MSSFIVSEQTMNNILNGLSNYRNQWMLKSLIDEQLGYDDDGLQSLGEKLFLLNQAGVMQRYPSDKTDYVQVPKFVWKYAIIDKFQFLKSCECLLYQCTEGTVDEEPLFKWLERLVDNLRCLIISEISEYKNARWDA